MVPENALKDGPTMFYQLMKALNLHADSSRDIHISKAQYAGTRHVVCLSVYGEAARSLLERNEHQNKDIVNIQHKNAGSGVGFQYALLEFQQVLVLGEVPEVLQ